MSRSTQLRSASVRWSLVALVVALAWWTVPGPAMAATPTVCPARFTIVRSGEPLGLPICADRPIDEAASTVHRLIVVIHGDSRNAASQLRYIERAAAERGVVDALIVAPQFLTADDLISAGLSSDTLYWDADAWKRGGASATTPLARPASTPAFAVVDELVARITDGTRFPNLRSVVIAGHSAGGQFVNRYAATNRVAATLAERGITTRYVVANPSSYLYLDARRYDPDSRTFRVLTSAEKAACPRFDTYRHGLAGTGPYGVALDGRAVRSQLATRSVAYLLGGLDTATDDPSLDSSCAARWQGRHRLERGQRYQRSLPVVLGSAASARQTFAVVPDVGHDAQAMYRSSAGLRALFD